MPTKRSSAAIRALKAKLQVFKKPSVWAAAMVLGLPLLFLVDYWQHPDKFSFANSGANLNAVGDLITDPTAETNTLPTISDASTILDLPDAANLSGTNTRPSDASSLKVDLLTRLLSTPSATSASKQTTASKPKSNSQPRTSRNPFAAGPSQPATTDLGNLFSAETTTPLNSGFPSQSSNSSATNGSSPASTTENPLQIAIQRILGQPTTSEQAAPSNAQTNVQSSSETEATAQAAPNSATPDPRIGQGYGQGYGQPSFSQPSSSFSQPSGIQPYVPQTSPAPGTTGYTLPPAFRTTTNTPSFYPSATSPNFTQIAPTVRSQPIPGSYSGSYGTTPGYGTTAPSPMPNYSAPSYASPQSQQAPFSVPRTPPGQYIGGGEINTFSNP